MGRSFTEGILRKIGFLPSPSEPHTVSLLRDRLIWHAALYGSEETTAFAGKKFQDLQDGRTVSPDIQKSVLMVGAREKDLEVFNWLENRFKTSPSEHDRINILTALGCFRRTETLEQALAFALTGVPDRNKFLPIVSAAANPAAAGTVWRWYLSHLDALEGFHPLLYERVIAAVVPVCGLEVPDTVEAFFREYLKKKGAPAEVIRMSLERLDVNRRLRERRQPR